MKTSGGLVMYRFDDGELKCFLVHPGGPAWIDKDIGVWSIPKGEVAPEDSSDILSAAIREFVEETGFLPEGPYIPLGKIVQKSGKVVHAWAFEDRLHVNPEHLHCNEILIEYPKGSGKQILIPECDRGGFFTLEECKVKILPAQYPLLETLKTKLDNSGESANVSV